MARSRNLYRHGRWPIHTTRFLWRAPHCYVSSSTRQQPTTNTKPRHETHHEGPVTLECDVRRLFDLVGRERSPLLRLERGDGVEPLSCFVQGVFPRPGVVVMVVVLVVAVHGLKPVVRVGAEKQQKQARWKYLHRCENSRARDASFGLAAIVLHVVLESIDRRPGSGPLI